MGRKLSSRSIVFGLGAVFLTAIMTSVAFTGVTVAAPEGVEVGAQAAPVNAPFVIGVPGYWVSTLNPFQFTTNDEYMTIWPVYSTLLTYDSQLNVVGDLATSYGSTPDGLTWTFALAQNAYFIDPAFPTSTNHPVTAEDIIYTLTVCQNFEHSLHYYDDLIESMTYSTPYDLTITLAYPYAPFEYTLTVMPIIPKYYWQPHEVRGNPTQWSISVPIGSGAFYYAQQGVPTSQALLKRNPIWFHEANEGWQVKVSDLTFKAETTSSAAETDLINGVVDEITYVTIDQYLNTLPTQPSIQLFGPNEGFVYEFNLNQMTDAMRSSFGYPFTLGTTNALLQEPSVKEALTMCVNRQQFIDEALSGLGTLADSLIPISSPWHYAYGTAPGEVPVSYAPSLARQQLNLAGWTYDQFGVFNPSATPLAKQGGMDVLRFRLYAPAIGVEYDALARMIITAAGQAGIDLASGYSLMSINQMNSVWYTADYDLWVWNWVMTPDSDPSADIMTVLTTEAIGTTSDVFFSDPTYDSIYAQSIQTTDPVARRSLVNELQIIAYESRACQCVAYRPSLYAVSTARWTNYGDWDSNIGLAPSFALPNLYLQLTPVGAPTPNLPPTVSLPDQYIVLKKVTNTYTATANDPDSDALLYIWNWGDGTSSVTYTNSATHVYARKGTFTLTVTVDDQTGSDGHRVSDSAIVVVKWPKL